MQIKSFLRLITFASVLLFLPFGWAADAPSVNINTASAEEIATVLVGVGLAKAKAIVEYRQANGAFQDVYELEQVKGIGPRTVSQNEARIRVK